MIAPPRASRPDPGLRSAGAGSLMPAAADAVIEIWARPGRRRWSQTAHHRNATRDPRMKPHQRALRSPARARRSSRKRSGLHPVEGSEHAPRLRTCFLQLALRIRVGDDAPTGANFNTAPYDRQSADENVHVHASVTAQEAQRPGIGTPALALELRNDLHTAELRAPGDGTAWENGAK